MCDFQTVWVGVRVRVGGDSLDQYLITWMEGKLEVPSCHTCVVFCGLDRQSRLALG